MSNLVHTTLYTQPCTHNIVALKRFVKKILEYRNERGASQKSDGKFFARLQVIAEREAWKLAELYGLDLVTVAPNFILGPLLSTRIDGLSAGFIKASALV